MTVKAKPLRGCLYLLACPGRRKRESHRGWAEREAVNNADGAISFDAITYGPRNIAGTYWYQITEKSTDELAAIYKMDESVKTVKVTLQKGADGDYLLSCEVVDGGRRSCCRFCGVTMRPSPRFPTTPTSRATRMRRIRRKSRILLTLRRPLRLLAMRTCFPKRGTALPTASLLALALGGLGLAAIARRLRRQ